MKTSKIIHLFVASILLFSTIGVVVNKHYSGGELFSTALFVKAQSCCASSCCHHERAGGCREESDYYRLEADYITPESETKLNLHGENFTFTSYELYSNVNSSSIVVSCNTMLILFKPPPKIPNLPVLYHSLLI
ncbi:MAG: hypothetical protein K9G76_07180 [Bacteroidales bacterium]|nr:hypothetical protein [Bacteroidales bacterium]MCF8404569.1 hypothetical protein [Bacteroidales bacterium]